MVRTSSRSRIFCVCKLVDFSCIRRGEHTGELRRKGLVGELNMCTPANLYSYKCQVYHTALFACVLFSIQIYIFTIFSVRRVEEMLSGAQGGGGLHHGVKFDFRSHI